MRLSLELVVIAIVILVVALVVLTIFGTGIMPFGWFSSTKNLCINQFTSSCQTTGQVPSDWGVPKYTDPSDPSKKIACSGLATCTCYPAGTDIPNRGKAIVNTAICT